MVAVVAADGVSVLCCTALSVGENCSVSDDCGNNMMCHPTSRLCACVSGFVPRVAGTCGKYIHDAGDDDDDDDYDDELVEQ